MITIFRSLVIIRYAIQQKGPTLMVIYIFKNSFIMSLRGTGRLFSIVAKEIRKKHLKEDITHAENRRKSRTMKLKEHYQIPQSNNHTIYLYSNIQGNQLILREKAFERFQVEQKEEAMDLIRHIHTDRNLVPMQVNKDLYGLWTKKKDFSKTLYFFQNQKIISISMIIIVVLFVFAIFFEPIIERGFSVQDYQYVKDEVYEAILISMLLLMLACGVCMVWTLNREYEMFDYDHEVVKTMVTQLKDYEQKAEYLNLRIESDREMTWIRFRVPIRSQQIDDSCSSLEPPVFGNKEDSIVEECSVQVRSES